MPCFKLHNPRRILVTELTKLGGGVISLEQGQFDVQLGKPVEFIELIEIANKLQLVGAYAGSDFSLPILQVEQNLTSLRVMTVTGVEAELAVPVKQTAKRAADATVDPLDQSIRDITNPQQPPASECARRCPINGQVARVNRTHQMLLLRSSALKRTKMRTRTTVRTTTLPKRTTKR